MGPVSLVWVVCLIAALTVPLADPAIGRMPSRVLVGALAAGAVVYYLLIRTRIRRGEAGPP